MGVKKMSVRVVKDGSKQKQKTVMHRLGSYTFMFAKRACNFKTGALRSANELTRTETGFMISNAVRDPRNNFPYARAVHDGHAGPIPPNGYAGNPWMRRGLVSALKMLGVKNPSLTKVSEN